MGIYYHSLVVFGVPLEYDDSMDCKVIKGTTIPLFYPDDEQFDDYNQYLCGYDDQFLGYRAYDADPEEKICIDDMDMEEIKTKFHAFLVDYYPDDASRILEMSKLYLYHASY